MSKAIIVTDFAYKGPKRSGRGTGRQGLKATLKYLQYRDKPNNHLAQTPGYERWQDRGMGRHYGDIFKQCDALQSQHVLAWTWVISPAPDLMALVPQEEWVDLSHLLIFHGRRCCDAKKPNCAACSVYALCPSALPR